MNMGQSLLTLGALILVSVIILNFNITANNVSASLDYDRYRMEAVSVLTSHIEQMSQYFFDEASTDTSNEKFLANFTAPNMLGIDGNDNGIYDDIDDMRGLAVTDTGISGVRYIVRYDVDYVTLNANQIVHSDARQYHKRIKITVIDGYTPPLIYHYNNNSQKIRDTLSVSVVVSYWFYN
jgi:hypothetical protein